MKDIELVFGRNRWEIIDINTGKVLQFSRDRKRMIEILNELRSKCGKT
jgi:hypothetical protein